MPQKTKVLQIANYFIYKNNSDPKPDFTNKKLQKLLYYSQAWNLVLNNEKMFEDKIEAWIHGPSIPIVYREFKEFGFNEINTKIEENDFKDVSGEDKKILDAVWEIYGKYLSGYLEALSHSEMPWQKARSELKPYESSNNEILVEDMKQYYAQKSK